MCLTKKKVDSNLGSIYLLEAESRANVGLASKSFVEMSKSKTKIESESKLVLEFNQWQ